jgi:hypothetical protein
MIEVVSARFLTTDDALCLHGRLAADAPAFTSPTERKSGRFGQAPQRAVAFCMAYRRSPRSTHVTNVPKMANVPGIAAMDRKCAAEMQQVDRGMVKSGENRWKYGRCLR